ncbi:hypothetical protein H4W32_003311 [Actinophytocola algeriensis]|uniref:Uncharacterized protein n=1 Tax=Actinophytocola algeriensis TaxID=1768010 RepID=A0A7W7VKB8_9PSEU|nr:hypothetical protein [Actinophytocola algeriensis]MBE1475269.1 hypothetical protein [Actinophytocola algeriensis]
MAGRPTSIQVRYLVNDTGDGAAYALTQALTELDNVTTEGVGCGL